MPFHSSEHTGEAIQIATNLAELSDNVSDPIGNGHRNAERRSVQRRIDHISYYMKSCRYCKVLQLFDSDPTHQNDCQNTLWVHRDYEAIDKVIVSHADYCAGTGAVDNASGMGVMATVARQCAKEQRRNVAFLLTDAEELGLLGSAAFVRKNSALCSPKQKRVFVNIDGVGKGKLIQLRSCLNRPELILPLPQLRVGSIRTDADTFIAHGLHVATISSFDDTVLASPMQENSFTCIDSDTFSRGNVCNLDSDTVHALDSSNLETAVDVVIDIIRSDRQKFGIVLE